jgi:hypothetical protein
MRYSNALVAAAFCAGLAGAVTPAAAAINCEGNFQVQKGGQRIATPYCEDGNLAAVAREYGTRTTAEEMRNNPNEKERICRFMGDDNRVRDTCAPYRNDDHGSDWR